VRNLAVHPELLPAAVWSTDLRNLCISIRTMPL
jgi:hypothetical protein